MPQQSSKPIDPDATASAAAEAIAETSKQPTAENEAESENESGEEATETVEGAEGAKEKKKRNRKRKIKDALTGKGKEKAEEVDSSTQIGNKLSKEQMSQFLDANPALKNELLSQVRGPKDLEEAMRKLSLSQLVTGLGQGRNTKDMGSHAFWSTQPVLSYDELQKKEQIVDGEIKKIDLDRVKKEPRALLTGFEWVTMDLTDEVQLEEVYDLLSNHYVEDAEAMFRFKYSPSFLNW